jgi:hypothetical protein
MRLDALLLADAVSAPPDGKFYLHGGGITHLNVPVLPFTIPQIGVFIRLEVDEDELGDPHTFKLAMTDPDGAFLVQPQEFAAGPIEAAPLAPGEERYIAIALNLGGITFGRAGLHHFDFHIDRELARSVPLPVVPLTAEQLEAMQTPQPAPPPIPPNRAARRQASRRRDSP